MTLPSLRRILLTLAACAGLILPQGAVAQALLRLTATPDEPPAELTRKTAPLVKYLESQLGIKVEYIPAPDQAAVVDALVTQKVNLVCLGGLNWLQALQRAGGQVLALVQREEDAFTRSVFITADPVIQKLADLRGKDVSFGATGSSSGHLMPRSFLQQAGLNPERDFRRVAYSGTHEATAAAVAAGKVQAGVLSLTAWNKWLADKKASDGPVRAFHTTEAYPDLLWAVHADMPSTLREAIARAFLTLSRDTPEGKATLDAQRTTHFVPAPTHPDPAIEAAANRAGLL